VSRFFPGIFRNQFAVMHNFQPGKSAKNSVELELKYSDLHTAA
jgi:hypothetical protein